MDKNILSLVGKPYVEHGRGGSLGYDCWGLAMVAIKFLTGVDIPDYKLDPTELANNAFMAYIAINDGSWNEMTKNDASGKVPAGLIVAFQYVEPGKITHVGVTLGNGSFIQCTEERGVTIEPLKKYQKLIEGYYSYAGK